MNRSLAVIIPALNEADHLGALLEDLEAQTLDFETVVVDGGSSDRTVDVARRHHVRVIDAPTGRADQMNVGRAAVNADWLLFLHADTRLPDDYTLVARALQAPANTECGHFRLRFQTDDRRFRFLEAKTALSRPFTTNGDQGLLVPASIFDALGGFDTTLGVMEDQRLVAAARGIGATWITLPGTLSTSARRFRRQGFRPQYFSMAVLMAAWAGGADELFDRYPNIYDADLAGLISAVRTVTRSMGGRRAWEVYSRAAQFIRGEAWQLFFFVDVLLADDAVEPPTDFLRWYDRVLADIELPVVDGLIAALCYVLLNLLLSPD